MWRTEPYMMEPNHKLPSQRHPMSKPQIFVHLEFGVSWSQRHTPRTHTVTYTSRNLRNSRDRGAFPRQLPPPNTNFLAGAENRQHRPREHREQPGHHYHYNQPSQQPQQQQQQPPQHHHHHHQQHQSEHVRGQDRPRDHGRSRQQQRDEGREQRLQRRESRSESRGMSHERGKSAPPPFHDSPWDAQPGPSASLFPLAAAAAADVTQDEPRVWKPLPEPPSRFRLGEDGLPWSAWAWPLDASESAQAAEDEDLPPFANQPTTLPIHTEQPRTDDGERVRELESLSAAMMTVDNGFENQWWHQGPRQMTGWWPRDQEEPSRLSMADATLFPAAEPPVSSAVVPPPHGWYAPTNVDERSSMLEGLVSPISTVSSPARVLHRSMTTRSEELFIGSAL